MDDDRRRGLRKVLRRLSSTPNINKTRYNALYITLGARNQAHFKELDETDGDEITSREKWLRFWCSAEKIRRRRSEMIYSTKEENV